jgi:F-type H+-transporting ATPase subunit b
MKALRRLVALSAVALVFSFGTAVAQEKPQSAPNKAEQSQAQHSQNEAGEQHRTANKAEGPGETLAEASEEAASEGEENAEFKKSPSVQFLARITGLKLKQAYWLAILLNFAVIAAAVIWFMRSKLPGLFRARTESIRKNMDEAQRASADANRRLGDIESRLAKLDSEVAAIRAQAEADAAAEEQRIKTAAEADARKIVESAAQEVEAASRLAQRELKSYAADLAISLAEKRIQVDATTDRALVDTFVGQLGKNGEGR